MIVSDHTERPGAVPYYGGEPRPAVNAAVPRVIAVSAGRCADGKSNSSLNLAIVFSRMGARVLLLDTGPCGSDADAMAGVVPKYNLRNFLTGEKTLEKVVVHGAADAMILSISSGGLSMTELGTDERVSLLGRLEGLARGFDIVIIDTGGGVSGNALFFDTAAEDIVTVVTPEPASIKEAYGLMRALARMRGRRVFKLLVDGAVSREEGLRVYGKLGSETDGLADISLEYLGCVIRGQGGRKEAVAGLYPDSEASRCYRDIARELCSLPVNRNRGLQLFWK